ncbi:hypothetical protein Pse7367_0915 [Thalassoporum mexicanum PCC 7367]|nr:hypothetical protein Pse7367_0915 [Pseudanabaena sp. PCC 7367]
MYIPFPCGEKLNSQISKFLYFYIDSKQEVTAMKMFQYLAQATSFISDAITRIFGPAKDDYPKTGVQPYTGDPHPDPSWQERE